MSSLCSLSDFVLNNCFSYDDCDAFWCPDGDFCGACYADPPRPEMTRSVLSLMLNTCLDQFWEIFFFLAIWWCQKSSEVLVVKGTRSFELGSVEFQFIVKEGSETLLFS